MNVFKFSLTSFVTVTLLMVPIALNFHVARANAENPLARAKAKNPLARTTQANIDPTEASDDTEVQSFELTKRGWIAQSEGNKETAAVYYIQALELNRENAYAYASLATLAGYTPEGIDLMETAAKLFQQQGKEKEYQAAIEWLNEGK
jgi:tetratricopeptide (TPR) repeat protein